MRVVTGAQINGTSGGLEFLKLARAALPAGDPVIVIRLCIVTVTPVLYLCQVDCGEAQNSPLRSVSVRGFIMMGWHNTDH